MLTKQILITAISLALVQRNFAQHQQAMQSINNNAPVKCSKQITINATPQKVWGVLTAIDQWSIWQTDITKPMLNGPLRANTTFTWKTGGAKINSTLHTVEPYSHFGWTGKTFGMQAIHNWTITEENGHILVTVNESMQGLPAMLFKKSFNKSLQQGMLRWLELLKKECEK